MQPEHRGVIGTGLVRWRFARPQSRILRIRMRVLIDSGTGSRLFDDQARERRFKIFVWLPANPDSDAPLVIFRMRAGTRSEEHTSELQSLISIAYAVFCTNKQKH